MNEKTISQAGYYMSQILRDLNQAKKALEKFKKADPDHPAVKEIEEKLSDTYLLTSAYYCSETIE